LEFVGHFYTHKLFDKYKPFEHVIQFYGCTEQVLQIELHN